MSSLLLLALHQSVEAGITEVKKSLMIAALAGSVCVAGLGGCAKTVNQRGYLFDDEVVEEIRAGIDNRSSVSAALGTPSMTATFDDETWYYVSQVKESIAFFEPNTVDQFILVVTFNDRGDVSDVSQLGLEDTNEISFVEQTTPTRGKELGFFEQIFSNIGRFSSDGPVDPGY
jgi:outer membrane protein assembly factor BamE (lipoprotein component of BamABCDE complex)